MTRVVDVHAHAMVREVQSAVQGHPGLAQARAGRKPPAMPSDVTIQLSDIGRRIADMDTAGIDVQVLSVAPPQYHYWAKPDLALAIARAAARGIAALIGQAPDRLTGLGVVPLQHPDLCVEALDDTLAQGLLGVEVSSYATRPGGGTVELSDPALEPFWARAAETGAVVFVHPIGCPLGERLDRFYLSNIVGNPVEHAVALSHLIFSGVLDRHPGLRVIAAHGGGYLPTYIGRSDHAWRVRPEARECAEPPSTYLGRLWFDSLVHSPEALQALVGVVGADRVLTGTDYPFDMGDTEPVRSVRAADLGAADTDLVLGGTAAALGLLPTSTPAPSGAVS